jgi:hypothetical protein
LIFAKHTSGVSCLVVVAILFVAAGWVTAGDDRFLFLGFTESTDKASQSIPEGWEPLTFIGTAGNALSVFCEHGLTVLHVQSLNSASGVLKRLNPQGGSGIDLTSYPFLVWRWKISRTVGMAIESREDRNDCAARVRVIFNTAPSSQERDEAIRKLAGAIGIELPMVEPSGYKIDYIWSARTPKGRIIEYPGESRHKMVILRQGDGAAHRWMWEQRNLIDDFRQCFNGEPPGVVGLVILTDTDQTNEGVDAWYGSIVMMRREP